ncbi:MAG: hypothetical protein HQL10_13435 [Nitrospirae bacterium]|nr:hypothetical protein [Nitrospirota bacterium]
MYKTALTVLLVALIIILKSELVFALEFGTKGPYLSERVTTGHENIDRYINTFIEPANTYYSVKIVGASLMVPRRNSFDNFFRSVDQAVMTSSIKLSSPGSSVSSEGINWIEKNIQSGNTYSFGIRPIIADCLPAIGTNISISVEFKILEKSPVKEYLNKLSSFINSPEQPLAINLALSAADGANLSTINAGAKIASKLVSVFFDDTSVKSSMKFSGSWSLINGLKSSYYYILGAYDGNALPSDVIARKLKVISSGDGATLAYEDGSPYIETSYVIFEVSNYPALGGILAPEWLNIYQEALNRAMDFHNMNRNPTDEKRQEAWKICNSIIDKAKAFADKDNRYLISEKNKQYEHTKNKCMELTLGITPTNMQQKIIAEVQANLETSSFVIRQKPTSASKNSNKYGTAVWKSLSKEAAIKALSSQLGNNQGK